MGILREFRENRSQTWIHNYTLTLCLSSYCSCTRGSSQQAWKINCRRSEVPCFSLGQRPWASYCSCNANNIFSPLYAKGFSTYLRFSNRHTHTWQWQRWISVHPALSSLICLKNFGSRSSDRHLLISWPKVLKFVNSLSFHLMHFRAWGGSVCFIPSSQEVALSRRLRNHELLGMFSHPSAGWTCASGRPFNGGIF